MSNCRISQRINPRQAISLILICLFLLLSCATKQTIRNESFTPHNWKKIAVLPFHGNELYNRVAGELFAFYLLDQQHFKIIEPYTIKHTLKRSEKELVHGHFTDKEAQEIGRLVDADAVIIGSFRRMHPVIAEAKLIDVKTGEHVLTVTRSSDATADNTSKVTPWTWAGQSSYHGHVVHAVENVAVDLLLLIDELSKKNITTHGVIH